MANEERVMVETTKVLNLFNGKCHVGHVCIMCVMSMNGQMDNAVMGP